VGVSEVEVAVAAACWFGLGLVEFIGREAMAHWAMRIGWAVVREELPLPDWHGPTAVRGATARVRYRWVRPSECVFMPKENPPGQRFALAGRIRVVDGVALVDGRIPLSLSLFLAGWFGVALLPFVAGVMREGIRSSLLQLLIPALWWPIGGMLAAAALGRPIQQFREHVDEVWRTLSAS
jgi:hypothetical protein